MGNFISAFGTFILIAIPLGIISSVFDIGFLTGNVIMFTAFFIATLQLAVCSSSPVLGFAIWAVAWTYEGIRALYSLLCSLFS